MCLPYNFCHYSAVYTAEGVSVILSLFCCSAETVYFGRNSLFRPKGIVSAIAGQPAIQLHFPVIHASVSVSHQLLLSIDWVIQWSAIWDQRPNFNDNCWSVTVPVGRARLQDDLPFRPGARAVKGLISRTTRPQFHLLRRCFWQVWKSDYVNGGKWGRPSCGHAWRGAWSGSR